MPSRMERLDTGRKLSKPDGTLTDEVYQLGEPWPGLADVSEEDPLRQLVALIEFFPERGVSGPVMEEGVDDQGRETETETSSMESESVPAHYVVWRAPTALLAVLYAPILTQQPPPPHMVEFIENVRQPRVIKDEQGNERMLPPERAFRRRIWLTPSAVRSDDESFDLAEAHEALVERLQEIHEEEAEEEMQAQPQNGAAQPSA